MEPTALFENQCQGIIKCMGPHKLPGKVKQAHTYIFVFRKRVLQLKCEDLHNIPSFS